MLHYVLPGATGGPNVYYDRIRKHEFLSNKYDFVQLNQNRTAGKKISFGLINELRKQIIKEKPDIIHISGMQSSGFHCMVAALLARCKVRLITTHGFQGSSLQISSYKKIIFNSVIEPFTLILATKVLGISKFTSNHKMVDRYARNKSTYIYNFPPLPHELEEDKSIRRDLGLREDDIIFTTVSRIVFDKGYEDLGNAIRKVSNLKHIKFLIVGDGEFEAQFKNLVSTEIESGKVIILGKRDDVPSILSESDVFVLPTLHENLGNVFLEASQAKIPSIATNVGGVPEVIIDGVTGILVPIHDSALLASAITELYNNADLRKKMAENAFKRIKTQFDSNRIAWEFDNLYNSLLHIDIQHKK
ncbi:glycosyltransferase family 4 protein [Exiguobacterium sp. s52]|nr:glycosyltransferase family 4 protein [Exiguobacterium sp. s52]